MTLVCGGRGPCCHVGYSHRHCEHCDVVIPLSVTPHTHWPYATYGVAYGGSGTYLGLAQQLQASNQLQALQQAVEVSE